MIHVVLSNKTECAKSVHRVGFSSNNVKVHLNQFLGQITSIFIFVVVSSLGVAIV